MLRRQLNQNLGVGLGDLRFNHSHLYPGILLQLLVWAQVPSAETHMVSLLRSDKHSGHFGQMQEGISHKGKEVLPGCSQKDHFIMNSVGGVGID